MSGREDWLAWLARYRFAGLDDWLTWALASRSRSEWAMRARRAMVAAVRSAAGDELSDPVLLIARVDRAYPFGERAMAPYKAWLAERKRLLAYLETPIPPPSEAEIFAISVAADALEENPLDVKRVLTILVAQAPNRHNLPCPACGAKGLRRRHTRRPPGVPEGTARTSWKQRKTVIVEPKPGEPCRAMQVRGDGSGELGRVELLIPHEARLRPPGAAAPALTPTSDGPLFERAAERPATSATSTTETP